MREVFFYVGAPPEEGVRPAEYDAWEEVPSLTPLHPLLESFLKKAHSDIASRAEDPDELFEGGLFADAKGNGAYLICYHSRDSYGALNALIRRAQSAGVQAYSPIAVKASEIEEFVGNEGAPIPPGL